MPRHRFILIRPSTLHLGRVPVLVTIPLSLSSSLQTLVLGGSDARVILTVRFVTASYCATFCRTAQNSADWKGWPNDFVAL